MAKRFIDTDLFRKPLMRGLEAPYKALWMYLLCECDHAGIWDVELDVAAMRLGMKLDPEKVVDKFGGAVIPVDGGAKWFLVGFVEFQYGTLNPANRVHASVLALLEKYGIDPSLKAENKGHSSPLNGAKDKAKDKEISEKERATTDPKAEFIAACKAVTDAAPERLAQDQRKAFLAYWTEPDKKGRMRWQCEKFFDHSRRMDTWMANANKRSDGGLFNGNGSTTYGKAEAEAEEAAIRKANGRDPQWGPVYDFEMSPELIAYNKTLLKSR